jgi:hypothetical protein
MMRAGCICSGYPGVAPENTDRMRVRNCPALSPLQRATRFLGCTVLLTVGGCGPLLSVPCAKPEPAQIVQPPAPVKCAPAAYADVVSMPMNKCGDGLCFDRENAQKLVAKIKALEACSNVQP